MDLGLKGKLALVNGGSTGIGLGIATVLANEGADILIASRNEKNLSAAKAQLEKFGTQIFTTQVDLLKEDSIRQMISQVPGGRSVDILINNVGGPTAGLVTDITLEQWDEGYHKLLRSVFVLSQLVLPSMRQNKWGRILTLTSTSARELIPRLPVSSTYRAGLTAWTKEMAKALGKDGILVNNLLPGPINTARIEELKVKSPEFYSTMTSKIAIGRLGEVKEVGNVAAFLCSEANTFVTGIDMIVDGGFTSAL